MYLKYFDQGYYTMPVRPASKASALPSGYSLHDWGSNGIPQELLEEWETKYPCPSHYGIAILCGKASNIIAVDIDTDDKNVLDIIPHSWVEKVGARPTRFFRYSDEFSEKKQVGKNEAKLKDQIEFLTTGQYCILPPSMHPDTKKQYFWSSGDDTLMWICGDELPELPFSVFRDLQVYYAKKYKEDLPESFTSVAIDLSKKHVSDTNDRCPHGSHDRLKQLAATLIRHEKPLIEGVRELYNYDKEHHKPIGYFWDKSRGADSKADPETNAVRFYASQLSFINRKRIMAGEEPHSVIGEDIIIELEGGESIKIDLHKLVPYPKPRGFMSMVQDHVQMLSPFRQDAISLGGALSLMSILAANRYRTQIGQYDIRPNLYVLNLAKSGAGKERTQSFLIDLLCNTPLLGSGGYKSGTAIVQGLPEQQERLNIIDEAASWLKSIGSGEGFQQEMNDVLSGLFTRVSGFYPGMTFATNKTEKLGACWNPSLSILASTTLHGFKSAVNQDMGAKGLMPRFLTFWQHELGSYKRPSKVNLQKANELEKQIVAFVQNQLRNEKRIHPAYDMAKAFNVDLESGETQTFGKRYDPILIPTTEEAENRYFEYAESKAPKDALTDTFEDAFLNRHAELAGKMALLDAVSLGLDQIGLESLEWAISVVEAQWNNMRAMFKETSAENLTEKNHIRVFEIIKSHGGEISKSDLAKKTQWLKKADRDAVLASLEESAHIAKIMLPDEGKRKAQYAYRVLFSEF